MLETYIKSCRYCGGTGGEYIPGLFGDGWTGNRCSMCHGWGSLLVLSGVEYELAGAHGSAYRNKQGRFAHIPEEAYETA